MTTLSKTLFFILIAASAAAFQEASAKDDIKVDDIFSKQDQQKIVHIIEHPADEVAAPLIQRALQGHVKNPIRPSSQILTNLTRKIIPSLLHSRNLPMPVHAPNILTTTPTWISQGSLAALGW